MQPNGNFIRKPIYSFCTKNNNQNDDENMSITHEMDVEMLEKLSKGSDLTDNDLMSYE